MESDKCRTLGDDKVKEYTRSYENAARIPIFVDFRDMYKI